MVKYIDEESDYDSFIKKNIKNQSEKKKRINKMIRFKKYLNNE